MPEDLQADVTIDPVEGRDGLQVGRTIRFGPFRLERLDRGAVESTAAPSSPLSPTRTAREQRQLTAFRLAGGQGAPVEVTCENVHCDAGRVDRHVTPQLGFVATPVYTEHEAWFVCAFDGVAGLQMVSDGGAPMRGALSKEPILVEPVLEYDRVAAPGIPGYVFRKEGRALGAVELAGPGRVVYRRGLAAETQRQMATAAAALLLFSDLR